MKKKVTKMPEKFCKDWNEVRLCMQLLKEGKARIVTGIRRDGSRYRYTKPL